LNTFFFFSFSSFYLLLGKSKGYGFVTFQDLSAAEKAKASPNLFFLGKTVRFSLCFFPFALNF
jgi:RNA recognition motif-containing protein